MLIDFIAEARKEIAERRSRAVDALIGSSLNHEIVRGQIQGLDAAADVLSEILKRYTDPEQDLPEAVTGKITSPSYRPLGSRTVTRGRA